MSVLFRRSFKTAIFSRFLKLAIARSNFTNEFYNGGFGPEFSVSVLKETFALVRDCVSQTRKEKANLAEKYIWKRNTKSFSNETLNLYVRHFKAIINDCKHKMIATD